MKIAVARLAEPARGDGFTIPAVSAEIRKILVQRIDDDRQSVGIVVGVVGPAGRHIVSHGALDQGDPRPLAGDTVFEIGSLTKVFTALLLAEMVQRGEVALADPVARYLPSRVVVPHRNGRHITLQDLATHRSGLPRMPSNFKPNDPSNPYADYTAEQMYQFLSTHELSRDVDSRFEYSNLGYGLLGHALERRGGADYESLVRTRILDPLGMNSTRIELSSDMRARLAPGHNGRLERVSSWDFLTLAAAGALRSTANDMLTFLAANLGYTQSPLGPAMTAMLQVPRAGRGTPMGWQIVTLDGLIVPNGRHIVWMNGGTYGYRSFLGFDPKIRTGVVVLSNAFRLSGAPSGVGDIDDIGLHLLDARFPLNHQPNEQTPALQ
jgi:serine-type D-Ala-D-Ala carboxypeptidase/endopeptidase